MRALPLSAAAAILAATAAPALAHDCPTLGPVSGNTVTQEFSAGGPGGMHKPAWKVSFGFALGKGLYITGAHFRQKPGDPWMRVLWDARLSDIFVPYHNGNPSNRYLDLSGFSFDLVAATPADAGACGRILAGKVINELDTSEVAWKDDDKVRYREEMTLWATLDAENYNYLIKYGFRDDGTIALRIAATAANLPGIPYVAHMHSGLWRIDMDLNGWPSDSALWMTHVETGLAAQDAAPPFNGGLEGSAIWDPEAFNHVLVQDQAKTNSHGRKISYEFMPVRMGSARHDEAFSKADFWVTQYDWTENDYTQIGGYANGESVSNTDVVVWHMSPMHHEPRDEDGFDDDGLWNGVALIMWSGLDIRPRNLWDRTPLYPND
jgi:Cu2+-containing amine oxidase